MGVMRMEQLHCSGNQAIYSERKRDTVVNTQCFSNTESAK